MGNSMKIIIPMSLGALEALMSKKRKKSSKKKNSQLYLNKIRTNQLQKLQVQRISKKKKSLKKQIHSLLSRSTLLKLQQSALPNQKSRKRIIDNLLCLCVKINLKKLFYNQLKLTFNLFFKILTKLQRIIICKKYCE